MGWFWFCGGFICFPSFLSSVTAPTAVQMNSWSYIFPTGSSDYGNKGGAARSSPFKKKPEQQNPPLWVSFICISPRSHFLAHRSAKKIHHLGREQSLTLLGFFSSRLFNAYQLAQWVREGGQGVFTGPMAVGALPSTTLSLAA